MERASFSPTFHGTEPSKPFSFTRHSPPENRPGQKKLVTFKVPESSFSGRTGACVVPGDDRALRTQARRLGVGLHALFHFQEDRDHLTTQEKLGANQASEQGARAGHGCQCL